MANCLVCHFNFKLIIMKKRNIFYLFLLFIVGITLSSCDDSYEEPLKRYPEFNNLHFTNEEMQMLYDICKELDINLSDLLIVIENESNYDKNAVNPYSGAVGLIQWTPNTLKDYGLTPKDVLNMSTLQQISLIKRYYKTYSKYNLNTLDKLLLCTFYPYGLKEYNNDKYVFGTEKSWKYARIIASQNHIYDLNHNGYINMAEFKQYHKKWKENK